MPNKYDITPDDIEQLARDIGEQVTAVETNRLIKFLELINHGKAYGSMERRGTSAAVRDQAKLAPGEQPKVTEPPSAEPNF